MLIRQRSKHTVACVRVVAFAAALSASGLAAQRQPVVMAHGIRSTDTTWFSTRAALQTAFPVTTFGQTTNWQATQSSQAGELSAGVFAGLPDSTLAVGHSNGGLVLRQAALNSVPLSGLVTVGTPNYGAPAAAAVLNGAMPGIIGPVVYDLTSFFALYHSETFNNEEYYYVSLLSFDVTAVLNIVTNLLLARVGFDSASDVWLGMYPSSPFLQTLNSPAVEQLEQQTLPRSRAAVQTRIQESDLALYRLALSQSSSENLATIVDVVGLSVIIGGISLADTACGYGGDGFDASRCEAGLYMSDAGWQFLRMPLRYCALAQIEGITVWDYYGSACDDTDAVVPYGNQVWHDSTFATRYPVFGVSHVEQTADLGVRTAIQAFLQTQNGLSPCGQGPVTSINFMMYDGDLHVGETKAMPLLRADLCAVMTTQGLPISVSSANPSIAAMGYSGGTPYISGVAPGTTEVTVVSGGLSETRLVTVLPMPYYR